MASKRYSYGDNKTAMANRPDHIPQSYQGRPTAYYGGSYGYYDPMGSFIAYTATQMIVTDMMLHSYAPHAAYHTAPTRVVYANSNGGGAGVVIGVLVGIVCVGALFALVIRNNG